MNLKTFKADNEQDRKTRVSEKFECFNCDTEFTTLDYWWISDYTDNGIVELKEADCPNCGELVIEEGKNDLDFL